MNQPSQALDKLTNTFTADRKFFDDLMAQPGGDAFVEMCVWYLWLHEYLHDIQNSLRDAGKSHGSNYQLWLVSMIGGIAQAIGMLMYLLARGIVHEAAASGRRALEYLGMVSHLVRNPEKARFLCQEETKSPNFKKAFIRGMDNNQIEKLRKVGISYRFAGMEARKAQAATQLYDIFSRFNVHGGTMSSLAGLALGPTENSCAFHNRSIAEVASNLRLFKPLLVITAGELMDLVAHHGLRNKRINQAGACVLVWLNENDLQWLEQVDSIRQNFGLESRSAPRPEKEG